MPKALERKLKRQVAGKDWSEERKDAYVYGVLRKTGWKPSTQKKSKQMSANDRVIRLAAINDRLNQIVQFQNTDDDDEQRRQRLATLGKIGIGAGALGAGAAGLYGVGKMAPTAIGAGPGGVYQLPGQSALGAAKSLGSDISSIGSGGARNIGSTIARGAGIAGQAGLSSAKDLLRRAALKSAEVLASSKMERLIQLNEKLNSNIEFVEPELKDPGAGQFGGNDPGIAGRIVQDTKQVSALQRLKLKIAKLRGMGLHTDGNSAQS